MTSSTDAPARPHLTDKGAATRARILAAAARLMYEQGVAATRTQQVQSEAGVGSSQLFHYFVDKGSLTEAVVAARCQDMVGIHAELLEEIHSLTEWEHYRDDVMELFQRRETGKGCPMGRLAGELAGRDEASRSRLEAGFSAWRAAARSALERLRDAGELDAAAPIDVLATALVAAIQGGLLLAQVQEDPAPLRDAMTVWIDAVRAHAGARS